MWEHSYAALEGPLFHDCAGSMAAQAARFARAIYISFWQVSRQCGVSAGKSPSRAKYAREMGHPAARLKPCPDTNLNLKLWQDDSFL